MLRHYVSENQEDWEVYVEPLTYAYNSHVHRTTRTTPFELFLSRPPPEFSLLRADGDAPRSERGDARAEFLKTWEDTIQKACGSLCRAQAWYRRDFDKRVRRSSTCLAPGSYVYLNPTDGSRTSNRLPLSALGPYQVLTNDGRTITVDRDGITERVAADRCVYAPHPIEAPSASTITPGDLADKLTEGTKYVVERLLRHRTMEDGTTAFLIKWADYDTPSWTAQTHVPEELVSRYTQRLWRCTGRDLNSDMNADVQS